MKTEEENKLIAEFMELPKCDRCDGECGHYKLFSTFFHPRGMEYHSSWDWLMPVIEKIESLGYQFTLYNYSSIIRSNNPIVAECRANCTSTDKLSSAYNTAIEFIKWFNQTKEG